MTPPTPTPQENDEADSLVAALSIQPGNVIAGKYRVEQVLAAGGMGVVVSARHLTLDQAVAVKLIRPELSARREVTARFLQEARAAAKVSSDHVARVTDVDQLPDRTPYMVMELLVGEDLHERLRREGRLALRDAVDIGVEALLGLAAAHEKGIVHRDLKPSNLFLEKVGAVRRVKLLDFGISKIVEAADPEANAVSAPTTGIGQLMGTPRYMSPEQVASAKDVDRRTDLWAIGVILYEALTGTTPFHGTSVGTLFAAILSGAFTPPRQLRPDLPADLEAALLIALRKDREDRYPDAGAMLRAIVPFASPRVRALAEAVVHEELPATRRVAEGGPAEEPAPLAAAGLSPDAIPTKLEGPPAPTLAAPSPGGDADVTASRSSVRGQSARSEGTQLSLTSGVAETRGSPTVWLVTGVVLSLGVGGYWAFGRPSKSAHEPAAQVVSVGSSRTAPTSVAATPDSAAVTPRGASEDPPAPIVTPGPSASSAASAQPAKVAGTARATAPSGARAPSATAASTAPPPPATSSTGGLIRTRD